MSENNKEKSISITRIAELANVSKMTVSRVIRGEPNVKPDTKKHVLKIMSTYGYVPSTSARSLRSKDNLLSEDNNLFAIIYGRGVEGAQSFFHDITIGAEQAAAEYRLCPLQVNWQGSIEDTWPRLQTLFSIKGLRGVILAGHFYEKEINSIFNKIENIVVIDGPAPDNPRIGSVEADNTGGCKIALEHLLAIGVKRVLILAVDSEHYFTHSMRDAASSFANKFDQITIVDNCLRSEDARETVQKLLNDGCRFDGIFSDDECAFGVLKALGDMNIRIPQEVKVVGFDDTPFDLYTTPPLSSVKIDKNLLGQEAVKKLVEILRSKGKKINTKTVIRASLMVRESSQIR